MSAAATIAIAGTGGIAFASAAWLAQAGHEVRVWSPGGRGADGLRDAPLQSTGVLEGSARVVVADTPAQALAGAKAVLIAVPVNGHRAVMDALLPALASGQTVIVSSMSSLSSLYLFEQARARGVDITVASMGTTVLTARRAGPAQVRVMTKRTELGVSALPVARADAALALCRELFGDVFVTDPNSLASALTNINPVAHGPLALFNWTRIERAENWPQYHYMTPQVAAVIGRLDAERIALAAAFGLQVRTIEAHFAKSFGTTSATLADIAAELHAKRGGPPGPTDTATRFLGEDVPYGLVFSAVLGKVAGVAMPATQTVVQTAGLILGRDLAAENDLIAPLRLEGESMQGLLARVNAA
ncbi:NAD/NADP octopine/nopaline dehydrogenase family protein [Caenimonas aquaedulcis]|uniref:2-dehydropantoate 2-reductase n=1 Tax=Caenimonas aquaedulcis TaxID=2793270 RepID=A0A931MI32_9BURK|nr:NAD/NADP-dependent octopine/nopaline dehydrogenase family protein [Caenimonas aquaedulcis]MBG9389419.1 NAD/NADP octopine/nopaline dehydrogenase family protein [Caenimonas aquaedulcis]